jgi:hypothetical protein
LFMRSQKSQILIQVDLAIRMVLVDTVTN